MASAARLVLIVEDHEDTRQLLRIILERSGVGVAESADGEAGADAAEELSPDLILMDGSLPRMDGCAATRRIRERNGGRRVPLIFLSGHASPVSRAEAFAAGCDDYLLKPIDFSELVRLLERHLCPRSPSGHEAA
jgi:two-component system, cell cycle response regulator DivK